MIVVIGSGAGTRFSLLTLGDLERRVAVVAGADRTPDEVGAKYAIQQAIMEMNANQWEFMRVRADDIVIYDHRTRTIGQEGYLGQYTLPLDVRDPGTALLYLQGDTTGRPLYWKRRSDWDRLAGTYDSAGTLYISDFSLGQNGKVELLAPPEVSGTMQLRYYAKVPQLREAADVLYVPADSPLEGFLIERAKHIVANNAGLAARRDAAGAYANLLWGHALNYDRDLIEHDIQLETDQESDPARPRRLRYQPGVWS